MMKSRAQYREHLLQSALDSFLRHGYEGTSFHALSLSSGISRDTLYRQYGGKEELFRAATGYGMAQLAEHLRIAVATRGPVERVLTRVALQIHEDITSRTALPVLRLIISEAHRFPDVAAQMFEDSRTSLAPLVDYLDQQRRAGALQFDDTFDAAFMLSTLAFGGVRMFLSKDAMSGRSRDRWVGQVVRTLIRGWKPR